MKFSRDKIKGILIIALGLCWFWLVLNYDKIMKKNPAYGVKQYLALLAGVVLTINGIRVFRRKG